MTYEELLAFTEKLQQEREALREEGKKKREAGLKLSKQKKEKGPKPLHQDPAIAAIYQDILDADT